MFLFSGDSSAHLYLKLQYPKLVLGEASAISNQDNYALCLSCNIPHHKLQSHICLFLQQLHIVNSLCLFFPMSLSLCSKSCSSQHNYRVDNAFFTFCLLLWRKEATDFHTQSMESGTCLSKTQTSSVTDQGDCWHQPTPSTTAGSPREYWDQHHTLHFPSFLQTERWAPSATWNTV